MSRRNKLLKFSELTRFDNVYQNFDPTIPQLITGLDTKVEMKGWWNKKHFKNDNPLIVELACGRGEYSLALAEKYPHKNFIGIDVKGARIWRGAKNALDQNLSNVAFLRMRIEKIANFFNSNEIDEIWITFPDPFLKASKSNRRLTSAYFINEYRKILKPKGLVHLKTDSPELYEFSLEVMSEDPRIDIIYTKDDIYAEDLYSQDLEIKTYYEIQHLGKQRKIKYLLFTIH